MNAPCLLLRVALLAAAALPGAALAERYRVDVLVFADRTVPTREQSQPVEAPEAARTFEPWEVVPLRNAGIEILDDELFGLMDEWKRLENSRDHEPLVRIAWIQADPPADRDVAIRLRHGKPLEAVTASGSTEVFPVDGWVALLAGRYLHVEASFVYTEATSEGELRSYRLRERRRLRRDELHHLDSPRLGLLVRAQRADAPAKPAPKKN